MWLKSGLTIALLVTGVHWSFRSRGERAVDAIEPVRVGEQFSVPLNGSGEPPQGCRTAFIISPNCGACQQLATAVGSDSATSALANLVWVSAATVDETAAFASTYALPTNRVFRVEAAQHAPGGIVLRRLGVRGVPTRVVVDSDGTVRDIELGGPVPTDSALAALCAGDSMIRDVG